MGCTMLASMCVSALFFIVAGAESTLEPTPRSNPEFNLLFIMSDQHRWDATSERGNKIVSTPNLDMLAKDGVLFKSAYTICPVCSPARTSMLSGLTPEQHQVTENGKCEKGPRKQTYDRVLLKEGYRGEYWGKYHSPPGYTKQDDGDSYYSVPVQDASELKTAQLEILDAEEPLQELEKGQLLDNHYMRPYFPDTADSMYDDAQDKDNIDDWNKLISKGKANKVPTSSDPNGQLALSSDHSRTGLTLRDGLAALDRLAGKPFVLTISFQSPHSPHLLPKPYYHMYKPSSVKEPKTYNDNLNWSPYKDKYDDAGSMDVVQHRSSNYYGQVTENDLAIGTLLQKLKDLGLESNTLVIYTSDHGEMLGDHHMTGKQVFYEGSAHIPLIMRLPGVIKAGTVVSEPVSNLALFGTIVDYLGAPGTAPATSESLRPLIEGRGGDNKVVFSTWYDYGGKVPAYMVYDGRFKLMIGREKSPSDDCIDALYDLNDDPDEKINLLQRSQANASLFWTGERVQWTPLDKATELQNKLVRWLEETGSSDANSVSKRSIETGHMGLMV